MTTDQWEYIKGCKNCHEDTQQSYCKCCGKNDKNSQYYSCQKEDESTDKTIFICEECYRGWALMELKK